MPLDYTREGTHGHVVTDPYPRFIRETLVDGGEEEVRVISIPQQPGTYAILNQLHFDGLDIQVIAQITRDEYNEATPSEIVEMVQARWFDKLLDLYAWIEDEYPCED